MCICICSPTAEASHQPETHSWYLTDKYSPVLIPGTRKINSDNIFKMS